MCNLIGSLKFSISLFLWPVKYTENILKSAGLHHVWWTEFGPLISRPQEQFRLLAKKHKKAATCNQREEAVPLAGCTCWNALCKNLQPLLVLLTAELGHRTSPRLCLTTPVWFCTQKLYALGTYFSECFRAARREGKVNPEALIWFSTVCPLRDLSCWQSQRLWWVLQMEWGWFPRYLWAFLKMLHLEQLSLSFHAFIIYEAIYKEETE